LKDQDLLAAKVIRTIHLHSKTLDAVIKSLTTSRSPYYKYKDIFDDITLCEIKNHILGDEFLTHSIRKYTEIFTKEELLKLLEIHQCKVMHKHNENCEILLELLFNSIKNYLDRYIGASSIWKLRNSHKWRQVYNHSRLLNSG